MPEPVHHRTARIVYDRSADLYVETVGTRVSSAFEAPLDRAVLDVFAERVRMAPTRTVLDAGCGPGRVAAYLADRGLMASGVDISTEMLARARAAHPALTFTEGSLTDLSVADHSIGGVVYWYSIIVTPPDELDAVWRELHRVLAPGGRALVAFQIGGDETVDRPDAYGSGVLLHLVRHSIEGVTRSLEDAGFVVQATIQRAPELPHESTSQGFVLAGRQT
ncbi:MAG: methyltransferase domain-containing protein [Acidimicrobiales bacterium]